MLKFKNIIVHNFGPFKGSQKIEFPKDHGVTIVYGQNMRGKTTLLNAIRFVLYGSVVSRGSSTIEYHNVINSEAADVGDYEFSVTLEFSYNDHNYKLVRIAKPINSAQKPGKHDDYSVEFFLIQDDIILSTLTRDLILEQIMPEQVSRFFLFDGELLQEYEELVSTENDIGRKIKEAIERILGVPILTNTRSDIESIKKIAQQTESKTAQADKSTKELGTLLSAKYEERDAQEAELSRLKASRAIKSNVKQELSVELKKSQKAQNLIIEKDKLTGEIYDLHKKILEKKEKIKDMMSTAWQWMLSSVLSTKQNENDEELFSLSKEITNILFLDEYKKLLQGGVDIDLCPSCERDLYVKEKEVIYQKISKIESIDIVEKNKKLELLRIQNARIKEISVPDKKEILLEVLKDIDEKRIEISDKEQQIKDIDKLIEGIDEKETRRLYREHEQAIRDLAILDQGIKDQEGIIASVNIDIGRLETRLSKLSGHNLKKDTYRRELCTQLYDLFDEGVGEYRDLLRDKIQEDSTILFLSLTTEPDFKGLRINENYGLNIIRKNDQIVPVRSAGAEHIVALSLMGALQKNAPFRGPIIMDSPFGRLDDQHTKSVVRSLPIMAKQVVLLVFKSELDPQLAKQELKQELYSEYQLKRIASTHTEIQKEI